MRTTLLALLILASSVWAHGGQFRGPNGGIPPGLRTPFDPEPPPPPPTDPAGPGGPKTPGPNRPGPGTPGPGTPGSSGPAPAPKSPGLSPKGPSTNRDTFNSWRFWWAYNNDDLLNLKDAIYGKRVSSASALHWASGEGENNVRDAMLPTRRAITTKIIPALRRSLNRARDHEDIHGGALIALGKVGTLEMAPMFEKAVFGRFRTNRGVPVKFGLQATESAVLALGMIPNLDDAGKKEVREICLRILDDDSLRSRERSWAAVCIGLQKDEGAIDALMERLHRKYKGEAKQDVPAAIYCALGLIGSPNSRDALETAFANQKLDDRARSFAGYAVGKIGSASSIVRLISTLKSRSTGRFIRRSAAIALGNCGANGDHEQKAAAIASLKRYIANSRGDRAGENFAIIAISRIGTPDAIRYLLATAKNGSTGQKPFAVLGLGTLVRYREMAKTPIDGSLLVRIRKTLAELSGKHKDTDTRAAIMLARGLVKDRTAIDQLVRIITRRGDDRLRGPCCVALGLMGREKVSREVKDALYIALQDRRSSDLRRDAATGLGLIRDAGSLNLLLSELEKSKSFTVQGQLILAIGTIGDAHAIAPLRDILDDTRRPAATRAMAAVGLGLIGDLQALPRLAQLSKDYNYRASTRDLDELLYIL